MSLITALINSNQAETEQEAKQIVQEMRKRVYFYEEDPEDVLMDYGLEPDYIFDIL